MTVACLRIETTDKEKIASEIVKVSERWNISDGIDLNDLVAANVYKDMNKWLPKAELKRLIVLDNENVESGSSQKHKM